MCAGENLVLFFFLLEVFEFDLIFGNMGIFIRTKPNGKQPKVRNDGGGAAILLVSKCD